MRQLPMIAIAACLSISIATANPNPVCLLAAKNPTRPLLLFEIDEGFSDGLLGQYRNDLAGLDKCLTNIRTALAPLTRKADVAVLVYPCQAYKPVGPSGPRRGGLAFVRPALLHLLDFFNTRQSGSPHIDVYLEIYSSGVATEQSGELDRTPIPLLGSGPNDHERLGLSMDMETIRALAESYPNVLRGVRFHEVYGSDASWKLHPEWKHGFITDSQVIRACVEVCREKRLRLVWSDSNWLMKFPPTASGPNYGFSPDHRPYFMSEPYRTLQDEAEDRLGSLLCFSWANNNYHYAPNLEFIGEKMTASAPGVARPLPSWLYFDMPFSKFPMRSRPHAAWGTSIQSWFWHELTYTLTGHYYLSGELQCPEEVMFAYVRNGLREGSSILQFEPGSYFFNEPMHGKPDFPGAFEQSADHSERLAFKRLKQAILDPNDSPQVPDRLDAVFDRNQQRFHENDSANPPKMFAQSTLGLAWLENGSTPSPSCYDFYSFGPRWLRQDVNRFGSWVHGGRLDDVHRVEIDGDGVDEFLVARRDASGGGILTFYNQNSGRLSEDSSIAADNAEGTLAGLTTANLIPEVIGQGDPDEIIVARKPRNGGSLILRVYKVTFVSEDRLTFHYSPLPDDQNRALLASIVPSEFLQPSKFIGMTGMRRDARIYANGTRSTDHLAMITRLPNGFRVTIKDNGHLKSSILTGIPGKSSDLSLCGLDEELKGKDSLLLTWRNESSHWLSTIYRANGLQFESFEQHEVAPSVGHQGKFRAFSLRKRILLNAVR